MCECNFSWQQFHTKRSMCRLDWILSNRNQVAVPLRHCAFTRRLGHYSTSNVRRHRTALSVTARCPKHPYAAFSFVFSPLFSHADVWRHKCRNISHVNGHGHGRNNGKLTVLISLKGNSGAKFSLYCFSFGLNVDISLKVGGSFIKVLGMIYRKWMRVKQFKVHQSVLGK